MFEVRSKGRATWERPLERPRSVLSRTVREASSLAGRARRRAAGLAALVFDDAIVARRYRGSSPGARGGPLDLFFVGREEHAREFEVYFDGAEDGLRTIEQERTSFRGTLAQYAIHARRGRIVFVASKARPEPVCGALLLDEGRGVLAYQINGFSPDGLESPRSLLERTAALELAVMKRAIEGRFEQIDLGYTRAILSSGLFVHKRRLGCTFAPVPDSPRFRVWVRPARRPTLFAAFPMLVGPPRAPTVVLGYDDDAPRTPKRGWRAALKNYRVPGLARAIVWSNADAEGARDPFGERCYLDALRETLDLPEGVDVRRVEK